MGCSVVCVCYIIIIIKRALSKFVHCMANFIMEMYQTNKNSKLSLKVGLLIVLFSTANLYSVVVTASVDFFSFPFVFFIIITGIAKMPQ